MIERIFLYDDRRGELPDLKELSRYIILHFPEVKVEIKPFIERRRSGTDIEGLARKFLSARVVDINKKVDAQSASKQEGFLPGELEYEIERLKNSAKSSYGIIYDGFEFLNIFKEIIPVENLKFDFTSLLFTNQLLGTFSDDDKRYHLRSGIYAPPVSVISVTGIVEAPARPEEYYVKKMSGADEISLQKEFGNRFIGHNDKKITEVAKGLLMQAVFYQLSGEAFCKEKNCRLFNAHWQEELIASQIKNRQEFCRRHKKMTPQRSEVSS